MKKSKGNKKKQKQKQNKILEMMLKPTNKKVSNIIIGLN